jgi:Na+/H+-dicarboxylate symporter
MTGRAGNIILIGMIAGAVLGLIGGLWLGDFMLSIKFLGTVFLNALKMVVIPLVVASIIVGVTSLGDIRKLGRTAGKTMAYYMATTGFSVLVGIILVNLIRPGDGVPPIGAAIPEFVALNGEGTIVDVIVGLIPDNILGAATAGKVLPLIVVSLLFGGVLTVIGDKGKPVIAFFEGINAAMMKIVLLIIHFAPIGILALIGGIVAENRESVDKLITALGFHSAIS